MRMKSELTVLIAVPEDATLIELHFLFTAHLLALSQIGAVEHKMYLLRTHDAHRHIGLLVGRVVAARGS